MKRSVLAWVAIVVPLWLVFVLCTHWEPVMRDGWGHYIWHRYYDLSLSGLWELTKGNYVHNNPRLGQTFTLLQHTPGPWHSIITPLLELALFYLLTTLALGRWPSLRKAGDALMFATIVAMVFASARSLGPMLFYRPFTGNYVFGLVLNLAWLVPFRLHAERPRRQWWLIPLMFALGIFSGLANEHTGPALAGAGMFAVIAFWRRGDKLVPWALAGMLGLIAGGLALYFAPGQEIRYNGLGNQSTLELITSRGVSGNARIIGLMVLYSLPLVLWLVLGIVGRARRAGEAMTRTQLVSICVGAGLALAIGATLLASPKQGDRLYFASTCLVAATLASWLLPQLGRVERWLVVALAAASIGFFSYRLLSTYHTTGAEFAERIATIARGAPGTTVTVKHYSLPRSRYMLRDDFEVPTLRAAVAYAFNLTAIEIVQRDATAAPAP